MPSSYAHHATDTRIRSLTPEGAALHYDIAGIGPRAYALIIDVLIRALILIVASLVLGVVASEFTEGLMLIFTFLVSWFYPVYFEVLHDGQTPGKKRVGLRVIHDDGSPIGFSASMLRNLLRVADFLPLFYTTGALSVMSSNRLQRLGDMAAGTLVVYVQEPIASAELSHSQVFVPKRMLSQEKQRAVVSLAIREAELSVERMEELSVKVLNHIHDGDLHENENHGDTATQIIVGYANYYLGRKPGTAAST